jgi:hypothetical protein
VLRAPAVWRTQCRVGQEKRNLGGVSLTSAAHTSPGQLRRHNLGAHLPVQFRVEQGMELQRSQLAGGRNVGSAALNVRRHSMQPICQLCALLYLPGPHAYRGAGWGGPWVSAGAHSTPGMPPLQHRQALFGCPLLFSDAHHDLREAVESTRESSEEESGWLLLRAIKDSYITMKGISAYIIQVRHTLPPHTHPMHTAHTLARAWAQAAIVRGSILSSVRCWLVGCRAARTTRPRQGSAASGWRS